MSRSNSYRVQVVQPDEAAALLRALGIGEERALGLPLQLKGHVIAACREADGSLAWGIDQSNLITDMGRRHLMGDQSYGSTKRIVTSPSTEPPLVERSTLLDGGSAGQQSGTLSGTYDSNTLTRTWATTIAAPATAKTISVIGLVDGASGGVQADYGVHFLLAYTMLPTPKQQTTTQTLEVTYKITMTPMT